jgi:hypothetical protein
VENHRKWLAVRELAVGDLLRTRCGCMVGVESPEDARKVETVYNWRIADYQSYYVRAREKGVGVWVHNAMYPTDQAGRQALADTLTQAGFKPTQDLSKMRKADIEAIAAALTKGADAFWASITKYKKVVIGPGGEIMDGHHRVIASVLAGKSILPDQIFRFPGQNLRPVFNWIDVLPT